MIKLVIFDYAGTTIDYGCMAPVEAFKKAFGDIAIDVSYEDIRGPMGMLKYDHTKELFKLQSVVSQYKKVYGRDIDQKDIDKVYHLFEKYLFLSLEEYTDLIDGVGECIDYFNNNGIVYGSTTGYNSKMMDIVTKSINAKGYYPMHLATANSAGLGRPHPHMIYENLIHFKMDPINTIKIGDTIVDIVEANNANVRSVGIVFGSSLLGLSKEEVTLLSQEEKEQLYLKYEKIYFDAGANYVVRELSDVIKLIDGINNA